MTSVDRRMGSIALAAACAATVLILTHGPRRGGAAGLRSGQRRPQTAARLLRAGGRRRPRRRAPPGGRGQRRSLRQLDGRPRPDARRGRPARHQRRRQDGREGALRRQELHRHRAAQRLSVRGDDDLGRTLQDHEGRVEAGWSSGDRRGRSAARPPAPGQGHRLRRQGLALRELRCALQRVPAAGSAAEGARAGPVPAAREAGRHLEVRRE